VISTIYSPPHAETRAAADGIFMKKEWIATFDMRTRHAHALLDGQLAEVKKPFKSEFGDIMYPGDLTAHPSNTYNCRCTTKSIILGFDKSKMTKATQTDRENVARWLEEKRKKDPEAFDKERKKVYNESTDKKQYAEYKARLGSDMPKGGFLAFQKLKYSDDKTYGELKDYYRYKGRVPEAKKSDFQIARKIKDLGVVGTVRVPAAKIDVSRLSAKDSHAFHHGCSIEDAKKYIYNAKVSIVKNRWDGLSINFYSFEGAAYLDYETQKLKTAYSKKDFRKKEGEINVDDILKIFDNKKEKK